MNAANVEALTGLLTWAMLDGADPQQVAFRLAERGVLVPAALAGAGLALAVVARILTHRGG